jgi:cytochrome P450
MASGTGKIPPGPAEAYDVGEELVTWMDAQRARFGNLYRATVYGKTVYVTSDPAHVQHILRRNWVNYRKGLAIRRVELLLGRGLISSEGEFWKSQRRLIQPAFHPQVLAGLTGAIADANADLLRRWEQAARDGESVNVTRDISLMVLGLVVGLIFGEDDAQVAPHFAILAEESARDLQFAQTFRPLRKVVADVATRRRAEGRVGMDFLGMLMAARDRDTGRPMPDNQLVTEIITLIVAGYETTALTLNWSWYLLARNPEAERKFADEIEEFRADPLPQPADARKPSYIRQVLDEAMRLYPPVWLITRRALRDDRLGEYVVPAGMEIYFSPYIIQRHPEFWEAPDRFDPDRFAPERVKDRPTLATHPFSAGPRSCIGEALARLEMEIHMTMVGRRLRLRSADEQTLVLEFGVNLRNRRDFVMLPERRAVAPAH